MSAVSKPIRLHNEAHRKDIRQHLLGLSVTDRYLRFCSTLSDFAINNYVDQLELYEKDVVFGVYDPSYTLVGMLHVVPTGTYKDSAEFALSVDETKRRHGIGDALFERGLLHCESVGIKHIYMNCLSSNQAIKKMAQKRNMTITTDYGETVATLDVNDTHRVTMWLMSVTRDQIALYDLQCLPMRNAWEEYLSHVKSILVKQ